jgi:hypothetical protein
MTNQRKKPKFKLALCELHCSRIHGGAENGHYLVMRTFDELDTITEEDDYDYDEEEDEEDDESINHNMWSMLYHYEDIVEQYQQHNPHRIIRNYLNIISESNYIKPEIIMTLKLKSGHRVAILKTFWIRILQRKWKKVFAERMRIIELWKKVGNIMWRKMRGTWPFECSYMPSLAGMLRGI